MSGLSFVFVRLTRSMQYASTLKVFSYHRVNLKLLTKHIKPNLRLLPYEKLNLDSFSLMNQNGQKNCIEEEFASGNLWVYINILTHGAKYFRHYHLHIRNKWIE